MKHFVYLIEFFPTRSRHNVIDVGNIALFWNELANAFPLNKSAEDFKILSKHWADFLVPGINILLAGLPPIVPETILLHLDEIVAGIADKNKSWRTGNICQLELDDRHWRHRAELL